MKKVICCLSVIAISILSAASIVLAEDSDTLRFYDVSAGTTNGYSSIMNLVQKGIVNGKTATEFYPEEPITREEFAKIVTLSSIEKLSVKKGSFSDIESGSMYEVYAETMKETGLMQGLQKNVFGVGSFVSKQDAAVIVYRLLDYLNISYTTDENMFIADAVEIADYAKPAVSTAVNLNLVDLNYEGKFFPNSFITRMEACQIIDRIGISADVNPVDHIASTMPVLKDIDEYKNHELANESFENGVHQLQTSNIYASTPITGDALQFIDNTVGHNSQCSLRLNAAGRMTSLYFDNIDPAATYYFSWDVKTEGLSANDTFQVYITWYSSNGTSIYGHYDKNGTVTGENDWFTQSFSEVAPTSDTPAAFCRIALIQSYGAKGTVWIDNLKVSQTLYEPMISVMSSPNYKGLLYEENGNDDINVDIYMQSDTLYDYDSLMLKVCILNEQNKVILSAEQDKVSSEMSVSFSSKYLNIGEHYLNLKLIDRTTGEIVGENEWTLRKKSQAYRPKFYFDKFGRQIKNGVPYFGLGIYGTGVVREDINDLKDTPFDVIMGGRRSPFLEHNGLLDEMAQYGLSATYNAVGMYYRPYKATPVPGINSIVDERTVIEDELKDIKYNNSDGFFGYYINDESPYTNWADRFRWHTDIFSAADLDHPTFGVSGSSVQAVRSFYRSHDIYSSDPYPIAGRDTDCIEQVYKCAKTLSDNTPNRPIWMVLQCCDLGVYGYDVDRGPTEQEMRNMAWQSVCGGAQGIAWYSLYDLSKDGADKPKEERFPEIIKVSQEVKDLSHVILSVEEVPVVNVSATNENMICHTVRRFNGKTYVILVNMLRDAQTVYVSIDNMTAVHGTYLNDSYSIVNNTVNISMGKYDVEILEIDHGEYLSSDTKLKFIGFHNENTSYVVTTYNEGRRINLPVGVKSLEYGIKANDKASVYINNRKVSPSGIINIENVDSLTIKIVAEDNRYSAEYPYQIVFK